MKAVLEYGQRVVIAGRGSFAIHIETETGETIASITYGDGRIVDIMGPAEHNSVLLSSVTRTGVVLGSCGHKIADIVGHREPCSTCREPRYPRDTHLADCSAAQVALQTDPHATVVCRDCGRAKWMHGTRHDTCSQFTLPEPLA